MYFTFKMKFLVTQQLFLSHVSVHEGYYDFNYYLNSKTLYLTNYNFQGVFMK